MASLPDGWRTAFDDGARTVAPAEVPLAVGPAGDVVVARDDGTVRDAALIGAVSSMSVLREIKPDDRSEPR